jgi:hypothetical protein
MRWLLDVIMKFLAWDDPKLCPIPVRASLALLIIAIGAITECHLCLGLSLGHSLAAFSIVLGVLAAGIQHWVSFASDQDLQRVSNEIANVGRSTKLSIRDNASVIAFAHLAFVMAYLLSAAGVLIAKEHPSQLKLPIWVALFGIWMIYFPCPPILVYVSNKMRRCLCSRWRIRLQGDTLNIEVRRILGSIRFYVVVVAGVLALLNVLFW